MGYYASGDWYAAGDPGLGGAIVRGGASALVRRFMPGMGTALAGYGALKGLEKVAARTKLGRKVKHMRGKFLRRVGLGRRHRRMNVCNPRALRRSLRRVKGFEHFAKQVVRIVSPKKRVSGFHFRRKRKR